MSRGSRARRQDADYIVVGAGSSGAIVAARPAEAGAHVVLVEAGRSDRNCLVSKPGMTGPMHQVPQLERPVDWCYFSTPQAGLDGRRMPVPRGKVVGGSGSVNGMVYVRGNRANYDSWATGGSAGWSADDVTESYRRLEDFDGGADDYRGSGGPIRITPGNLPDGQRRASPHRPRRPRARGRGTSSGRRRHHADHHRGQYERAVSHDRRAGRRPHARPAARSDCPANVVRDNPPTSSASLLIDTGGDRYDATAEPSEWHFGRRSLDGLGEAADPTS